MGGMGSGSTAKRVTVESAFRLDLGTLLAKVPEGGSHFRAVMARDGGRLCRATDRIDVEMKIAPERGWVRLRYTATTHRDDNLPGDDWVELVSAPQPYGGRQWWFECPHLGCRVKALFLPWGCSRFLSRQAWGLSYTSSRLSPKDRALDTAQKIRLSMDGEPAVFDAFPPRPSGMRRKRYKRLRARAETAGAFSMATLYAWFDQVDAKEVKRRAKEGVILARG